MATAQQSGLSAYFGALRRRVRLLAYLALPIIAAALVLAAALPDVYESSGLISIEQERLEGVKSGARAATDDFVQEYIRSISNRLFTSREVAKAVEEIEPYTDLVANPAAAAARMIRDSRLDMVRSTILDPMSGREREIISSFRITYGNHDPNKAYSGASWLTNAFIQADRNVREGRAASTGDFFNKEAERVAERMAELEKKLAEFKRTNYGKLPELTAVNMSSMDRIERELESVELQASMLRKDRVYIQQRLGEANSTSNNSEQLAKAEDEFRKKSATYDPSHPDVIALRRQIETLKLAGSGGGGASLQDQLVAERATLTEARQRYSEDHPDVRRIQRNIDALEKRIASGEKVSATRGRTAASEQLDVQLRSTDTQIASFEARAAELRGKMGVVEDRVASTPEVEREYQMLTRDMTQARAKYEQLLGSKMDSEINRAAIAEGKADEFRIFQTPSKPTSPAKPARVAIAVIGLMVGAFLGLIGVGVAEATDPTVRGLRDIQSILAVTPLAVVPTIRNSIYRKQHRLAVTSLAASLVLGCVALFAGVRLWVN